MMTKKYCLKIIFLLALFVSIFFTLTTCKNDQQDKIPLSNVYIYEISGKDSKASYNGKIVIILNDINSNLVTAYRQTIYKGEKPLNIVGSGTLNNDNIEIRFGNPAISNQLKKSEFLGANFKPGIIESFYLTGSLNANMESGKVFTMSGKQNKYGRGTENWKLVKKSGLYNKSVKKIMLKKGEWSKIPLEIKREGLVKITSNDNSMPRGFFIKKGEKIPEIKFIEEDECLAYQESSRNLSNGKANINTEKEGSIWLKNFGKDELKYEWIFAYRDDFYKRKPELELFYAEIDSVVLDKIVCDPWVEIDVSPNQVAVGGQINITVRARAFAGLDMFWWFGNNTGLTDIDKAHIMAGNGNEYGEYTWTVTINEPGTYSFGANARDALYWSNPGTPHQASEGCGMSYDVVTVLPQVRKSYTVAFILLAPEGTDVASENVQSQLTKLDDIKAALVNQFITSTEGHGLVDVSYPTVVLTPPEPVYDLYDGNLMYTFVRETISNYFYTAHADVFDFIAVYEMYLDKNIGGRHLTIKTFEAGFGITPYDISSSYGSNGTLRGLGLITDITDLPDTYNFNDSDMHLLLHEVFGHQWGVFANKIMKPGYHFDIGTESPNFTVLYGRPWIKVDETHFTTAEIIDPSTGAWLVTFHPWMLYVAGMKMYNEIPNTLMDVEPDNPPQSRYAIVTSTGTYTNVTLQSLIDESGDRYDVIW